MQVSFFVEMFPTDSLSIPVISSDHTLPSLVDLHSGDFGRLKLGGMECIVTGYVEWMDRCTEKAKLSQLSSRPSPHRACPSHSPRPPRPNPLTVIMRGSGGGEGEGEGEGERWKVKGGAIWVCKWDMGVGLVQGAWRGVKGG